MRPDVRLEHAARHERLVALDALVRLLSSVRADVLLEVARLLEAAVAEVAAVRPVDAQFHACVRVVAAVLALRLH